jgi:hypothetical protein
MNIKKKPLDFSRGFFVDNYIEIWNIYFTPTDFLDTYNLITLVSRNIIENHLFIKV